MKKLSIFKSSKKKLKCIDTCKNSFVITDNEADEILGGFREYKPSIYTQNQSIFQLKIKDLLANLINNK